MRLDRASDADDDAEPLVTALEFDGQHHAPTTRGAFDAALRPLDPPLISLHFHVTRDEECASLTAAYDGRRVEFGQRSHHYGLLMLARRRVADAQLGLPEESSGWILRRELGSMLKVNTVHLNVLVFRARQQWQTALPDWGERVEVLERRRGALRLGPFPFLIYRDGSIEARYPTSGVERPRRVNPITSQVTDLRHPDGALGPSA